MEFKLLIIVTFLLAISSDIQIASLPPKNCDLYEEVIMTALDSSTTLLMSQGGDDRLHLDSTTNMNKYFTSPIALDKEIARSSCTSSRPTGQAFNAAEKLRLLLLSECKKGNKNIIDNVAVAMRERIKKAFVRKNNENVHVICTPSGSDAEMLFSLLALLRQSVDFSGGGSYVSNILVASSEVGSGTAEAAKMCHFSDYTPLGPLVKKGKSIQGVSQDAIQIISFKTRDSFSGYVLPKKDLELLVVQAIERDIAQGKVVVVHMVHCSKTGVGTPTIAFMRKLKKKYQERIVAVVDVAQGRCSDSCISKMLSNGLCVLVTGSKFFAGVPFCGAVLIPDSEASAFKKSGSIPVGLQDYFSAYDVDKTLVGLRNGLLEKPNIGSLLRWESALCEIEKYFSYNEVLRTKLAQNWVEKINAMVRQSNSCILLEDIADPTELSEKSSILGGCNTVISFFLKKNKIQFFTVEELKKIHGLMSYNISDLLPSYATQEERAAVSNMFLLGQPVTIIGNIGILRIALSAPMISSMAEQVSNNTLESVIAKNVQQDFLLLNKIEVIARYYGELTS